jgi:hypothetical protein
MRPLILILVLACVVGGCDWTPVRDNAVDEKSPYYVPPPWVNRPPQVRNVSALTDCRANSAGANLYMFEVLSDIVDPDYNLIPDSLRAFADTIYVGTLVYNPDVQHFYVRVTPESLPGVNIETLFNSIVTVKVADSGGARDSAQARFNPLLQPWPTVRYPSGDSLGSRIVRLGWNDWAGGRLHTYSISVWKENLYVVWDTSGLAGTDTVLAEVSFQDWEDSHVAPWVFYAWYLTVVDNFGNRITGDQAVFRIWLPGLQGPADTVEPTAATMKPE